MWTLLALLISSRAVLSQGENRLMLHGGDHPCQGYVRLFMEGKWGVVGSDGWTEVNERVVCKSIGCGAPLRNSSDMTLREDDRKQVWLNNLNCTGTEAHLWQCPGGAGLGIGVYTKDTVKKITCSEEVVLGLFGYKCAGAVYYTKKKENSSTFFCDNWDRGPEDKFAKDLCKNCGGLEKADKRLFTEPVLTRLPYRRVTTQCTAPKAETHPWQCDPKEASCDRPAVIVCQDHDVWRINGGSERCSGAAVRREGVPVKCDEEADNSTCERMRCGAFISRACDEHGNMLLTCSDKIKVILKKPGSAPGESDSFGEVHVVGSMGELRVCASNWTTVNSKVVCRELGFGELISSTIVKKSPQASGITWIMDDVKCSGEEASLWDCKAKYSKAKRPPCDKAASVTCGASLHVRLADGPGRCAGRLELKLAGEWYRVGKVWSKENSDVVCKKLRCGEARPNQFLDKISPGSLPFLTKKFTCKSSQELSTCPLEEKELRAKDRQPTMLVCEDHLEVFVKGSSWCEGQVGVRQHDDHFWLSGSNATWTKTAADLVCGQMHCGRAEDYHSIPLNAATTLGMNLWLKEYNCTTSKEKSLFDCPDSIVSSQTDNPTIAFVRCAGKITLKLKSQCWGEVMVEVNNNNGSVCRHSWSDDKSKALCKSMHCGHYITMPKDLPVSGSLPITVKSLHFHQGLSTKSLVLNDPEAIDCKGQSAMVACSGSMKFQMSVSRDYCFGTVGLVTEDWSQDQRPRLICSDALKSQELRDAICADLGCGESAAGDLETVEFLPQSPGPYSMVALTCNRLEGSCYPTLEDSNCATGRLKCSDWRRLVLKSPEGGGACEGVVFVYSESDPLLVSSQGWTAVEGDVLCRDLGCGEYQSHREEDPDGVAMWGTFNFNCMGVATDKLRKKPRNIWDCLQSDGVAENKRSKRLHLTCQGHRNTSLSKDCRGKVQLNNQPVVKHGWKLNDSHIVCEELGCGNAFKDFDSGGGKAAAGQTLQVSCLGPEGRLGQCLTSVGAHKSPPVSVFCNHAFKFNTTERCGGRVAVQYPDEEWKKLCLVGSLHDKVKDHLCEMLSCGKPITQESPLTTSKEEKQEDLKMRLECSKNHMDIRYCVSMQPCKGAKAAEIYCDGYVPPPPTDLRLPVGIVSGLVVLLLAVGLFFLLRRRLLRTGVSKRRDMEVDTSDYDDVGSSVNGKGSLSRMDSRSLPAEVPWNDSDNVSLSYDDIAEAGPGETLPLTKEEAPEEETPEDNPKICYVVPSSDSPSHGAGVLEDYDDVTEPEPQVAEAPAGGADSGLKTPHRELPEVPPDDMEGDYDYLEQDPPG